MPTSWREFWDRRTAIYASEWHRTRHYARIAADIGALVPHPRAHLLDHGCGEALSADEVARICGRLYLCDAAPRVREALRERFRTEPRIVVLADEDLSYLPDGSLDLVVAHSVSQYLTGAEFDAALAVWRAKLRPGGRLVVGDVVPPDLGPLADAGDLLAFGWREGFLLAALLGLVRTAFSDYPALRRRLGLTRYMPDEMLERLRRAGFAAERHPNLGHSRHRLAFLAEVPSS
ncbi:class I SAM-dependent methyltransferase [Methylobacterium sp. JK268]